MTAFILIMFTLAVLVSALGSYILWLKSRDKSHRLFFLLAQSVAIFSLFGVFVMLSEDAGSAWFWFRFASVFIILFFPLLAHFCVSLTRIPKWPWLPIIFFALSLPVHYRNLFSTYMFESITRSGGTWLLAPATRSFWMYYWFAYAYGMGIFGSISLLIHGRRARTLRERKQSVLLSVFILTALSLGIIESLVAQLFGMISTTQFFIILIIVGIWIAMLKYRLLTVTDKKVCKDILETMDAFIVMLDSEERVVMTNRTAERLLGQSLKDTAGKPLAEIIGDSADCREALVSLKAGRPAPGECHVSFSGGNTELALQFSLVKDAAGEPLGFMVLGHEVRGVRHFLKRYQITAREWEAIHRLVTGATNREIADTLSIAERTVKAHLSNVYGKLGVENKVQMIAVLKENGLY